MSEHGMFTWNELWTHKVEEAKAFYAKTIGWSFDAMPMGDRTYWVAKANGKPAGGIMDVSGYELPGAPPRWVSYLAVDDVDERLKGLSKAGGKVVRDPFDIPGVGRIALVEDSAGAKMGWMTPEDMRKK